MTENKIAKDIGLIYKAKPYLNKNSLLASYFSYIHSYIKYANLVWRGTHRTYLRKIYSQQKHASRLLRDKNRFYHSKELFESCEILNVYKLNLLDTVVFMHKMKNRTAPPLFLEKFEQPSHCILHAFEEGITGNHNLNYANVDFELPLEVQQYGTT